MKHAKKTVVLLLVFALCSGILSISACSSKSNLTTSNESTQSEQNAEAPVVTEAPTAVPEPTATPEPTEEPNPTEEPIKKIKKGDTVSIKNYKFKLRNVNLSYDVKPNRPDSFYSHYPAESGKVYIHIDATIKNQQKQRLDCDEVYSVRAYYNDSYEYDGFLVAEDGPGDFTYASIEDISPLETKGVHALIECPEEVETSKAPLFIIITLLDDSQYKYKIR